MELYEWKINMKNGDKFIIKNKYSNSVEFLKELFGHGERGMVINHYEIARRDDKSNETNAVAILNTEVSSVEYITKWNYE